MLVFIYYISYQLSHPYWHESKVLYKQVFMFLFIDQFSYGREFLITYILLPNVLRACTRSAANTV